MKLYIQKYESFEESVDSFGTAINEGIFDKLKNLYSNITKMFLDKPKLTKSVNATLTESGDKSKTFIPKNSKVGTTTMLVLGDGKNAALDFSIALTKLADFPDGSTIFSITGTTSDDMLKALTGTTKEENLSLNSIMALVTDKSFQKGKPVTMKLLKNMIPGGKDYMTKSLFNGAVPYESVQKVLSKAV